MASKKPVKTDTYHHGNLREACIEMGLQYLRDGEMNFSMRDLARAIGVSHGAPAKHFGNKDGLMAAIAEEGFRKFNGYLEQIEKDHSDPTETFYQMGKNYIRFGLDYPQHYKLMFALKMDKSDHPSLLEESSKSFGHLIEMVTWLQSEKVIKEGQPLNHAYCIWSSVHGLVSLAVDGRMNIAAQMGLIDPKELEDQRKVLDDLVDQMLNSMMNGMKK